MIIELFGPPGVGKTTFARALTTRLRQSGHVAELTLSCRPAERRGSAEPCPPTGARPRITAAPRRLSRPLVEMLAIARHPFALSHDIGAAAGLLKILPPRNMAAAIRLSQYILRLSYSWSRAAASGHIVLFDQGFVQLVCSLVLVGRSPDKSLIAQALEASPRSDLLIRLDAPPELLSARLKDRERGQSAIERLFELDLHTSLKSMLVIDQLHRLLVERDKSVVCASSLDQHSLSESVSAIEGILAARFGVVGRRGDEAASGQPRGQGRRPLKEECRHA
jgi:thymidylate kinase